MANRAKTSEWIFEDVFCAGVWVASAPLHGTRKITKSGNMLKAEIGREQLSFASNNLSANFNACHRISIFLSSIPKSPQPPIPRAERRSKRRSAVFSIYSRQQEPSRHMQDFKRRFGVIRWKFLKAGSSALMEQWMPEA